MDKSGFGLLCLCVVIPFFLQCEKPNSPDFTFSRTVEFPVVNERSLPFMGGSEALIDTTSENLQNLFSVDEQSFITLSRDENFDFGNLNDVIPAMPVETEEFRVQVGQIEIGNFSSVNQIGSLPFSSVTGLDGLDEGDTIPEGNTDAPVSTDLETDYFVSATVEEGEILVELENDLGIDISNVEVTLRSNGSEVGSSQIPVLSHGATELIFIPLATGTVLEELSLDIELGWNEQELQAEPGELSVNDLSGRDLVASEAVAILEPQQIFFSDEIGINDDEFQFDSPEHYVELESGSLQISNIINELEVELDVVRLSFPDIRHPPFEESDSLIVTVDGSNSIHQVDLTGVRIYGEGNRLDYHLFAETEDNQSSPDSEPVRIHQDDRLGADIGLFDLVIRQAVGIAANRQVFLNQDDPTNGIGIIDLDNQNEAEVIQIEGLQEFSGKLEGIEFTDARFSIRYQTNIGFPLRVIGAFMGVTPDGESFFLAGRQGEDTFVENISLAEGLYYSGQQLNETQLIQFDVDASTGGVVGGAFTFDRNNSTISEFLNRLPSEVRFIGIADLNRPGISGTISTPVEFDPAITLDIPMNVQTVEEAVYRDTLEQDLSDLPGEGDDTVIDEALLSIHYKNRIPVQLSLNLDFLEEQDLPVTTIPLPGEEEMLMRAASTDDSGFSLPGEESGRLVIPLNREQLQQLNQTRQIKLQLGLQTYDQQEVRLRSTDAVSFSVGIKFTIESEVK